MIKITVDEAYAFDYLSILEIKNKKLSSINDTLETVKNDLIEQIGLTKVIDILDSKEYKELYDSNERTFLAVDMAKNDLVKASYVDKCNYDRMICKRELQKKFFTEDLTEKKIGYEKLKVDK